ncbi:MAG: murein L,D-transpeptidase [Clostridiales bacterium]|nr:murein L,D-transpeptidase [Clostridiales bacterium]
MKLLIEKEKHLMHLMDGEQAVFSCPVALGREPRGAKRREGDGRTPEGIYYICLIKEQGKYGRSLGLSYPGKTDAELAFSEGVIDLQAKNAIFSAWERQVRPPWGTALGGEIYIHEGGTASDWTQGCIALDEADMDRLFPHRENIAVVEILP